MRVKLDFATQMHFRLISVHKRDRQIAIVEESVDRAPTMCKDGCCGEVCIEVRKMGRSLEEDPVAPAGMLRAVVLVKVAEMMGHAEVLSHPSGL